MTDNNVSACATEQSGEADTQACDNAASQGSTSSGHAGSELCLLGLPAEVTLMIQHDQQQGSCSGTHGCTLM